MGYEFKIGDTVVAPDPRWDDSWNFMFTGNIVGFREDKDTILAQVEDLDGNVFDIEVSRINFIEVDINPISDMIESRSEAQSWSQLALESWSQEWPSEEGFYWFYGWESQYCKGNGDPRLNMAIVSKLGKTATVVMNGAFVYKTEGLEGFWQKINNPITPVIEPHIKRGSQVQYEYNYYEVSSINYSRGTAFIKNNDSSFDREVQIEDLTLIK